MIAIIDFGSQYTQLIAKKIRALHVFSKIYPDSVCLEQLHEDSAKGVILSGGPSSVYGSDAPHVDADILASDLPMLGICYGLQLLVQNSGGEVLHKKRGEYGQAQLQKSSDSPLLKDIPNDSQIWMSHGDEVHFPGESWQEIAVSENGVLAAAACTKNPHFGVQFHPEVEHSHDGKQLLANFSFQICHAKADWTPENFIEAAVEKIRAEVGDKRVLLGISGGVDSSVAAVLLNRAIGAQAVCVFVNNGLLRKNEAEDVLATLRGDLKLNVQYFDESKKFLSRLAGVTEPETKRKIIGNQFIRSFESAVGSLGHIDYLAQGTLYTDIIESGAIGTGSHNIKSHHNVGGLPDDMQFKLLEPLRDIFKDEVRSTGRALNMPAHVLGRHPFPGPGLAVRILGEVTAERVAILQEADDIYIQLLRETDEYDKIWQAFAVLVPVKTVGVQGDKRSYANLLALRAVGSSDGMTANWYNMPHDVLNTAAKRIINQVPGINRVVYDITGKPPGTIEWE